MLIPGPRNQRSSGREAVHWQSTPLASRASSCRLAGAPKGPMRQRKACLGGVAPTDSELASPQMAVVVGSNGRNIRYGKYFF